jgi:hypothetical protein
VIPLAEAERIVRWYLPGGPEHEPIKDGVVRLLRESAARSWRARVVATAFRDAA